MKKQQSRHSKSKTNKMQIICIVIFIIGVLYIAYYLYSNYKNKQDNDNVLNEVEIDIEQVTEQKTERTLQLEELQKENADIIGWLQIDDTNINYPVLQGTDNNFYMTHNYKKEYSKDGSIFLDKEYNFEVPSTNLLMYGHNNKNGTMFQDLIKYQEESFYKEHPTIKFTTLNEDVEYEIIAAFKSRVYYKKETNVFRYYFFINAENEEEYNYYINESKKASIYDTGKTAKYGNQLLTLSTCSYHVKDGRFVVVAKRIN